MNDQYKNSYKATAKELVSLSAYNVGYQLCDAGYQWGPGIRDHYLIHYVISGKGTYEVNNETHSLSAGDAFLVYPNTEIIYRADTKTPWEYAWVGFTGSDAATILQATDFSRKHPCIHAVPNGEEVKRQLLHIYDARGNGFEHAVEMTGFHPKRNAADSRNLRPEKYRIYQRQLLLPDHSGRYCRLRRFKPQPSVPFL